MNIHERKGYSCTPDRDFRCFYPCEIILYPYQKVGKIKMNSSMLAAHQSVSVIIVMLK